MKNLAHIGPQARLMHAKLENARVYGSATSSNGAVHVEMSGLGIVTSVSIAPTLLQSDQQIAVQQLVQDAVNQANRAAKELHIQAVKDLTGGSELFPGFNDLLKNFAG